MTFLPARFATGTNQVHTTGSQCSFSQDPGTLQSRCKGRCDLQHPWVTTSFHREQVPHPCGLALNLKVPQAVPHSFLIKSKLWLILPAGFVLPWVLMILVRSIPQGYTGPSFRCPKHKFKYWMSSRISNFSRKKTNCIGPWKHLQPTIPHC